MESHNNIAFRLYENGCFTMTSSDLVELVNKVYKIIYKLVEPQLILDTHQTESHYENMVCDCSLSFTNKVVFEMYDDGTFSIMSCSDLEAACNMVYQKIYKTTKASPTVDGILARRQARLEAYRREYEMNNTDAFQKPNRCDEVKDEIDG